MERRSCPIPASRVFDRPRRIVLAGILAAVSALGLPWLALNAGAQTMADSIQGQALSGTGKQDRMIVEAQQMIYNRDNGTVTAKGDVQIYYKGQVLEADRVIYNQKTKRLFAEGNAKLTDADGTISYGSRFDLSDNFRDGFVDSLTARTTDSTRITAPRAERTDAETTVFENATYTACAPCAAHPEKPPLWQIKAKKIIHKNKEQTIYYEDATLEFFGIPFAWVPFLSTPDASVERRSGVLVPRYTYNNYLGQGVGVPIYWAMAPNYDLTVTPTYFAKQGLLTQAEFRQRMMYGSYNIRAAGIFQNDPNAFAVAPYGSGQRDFRGSIASTGKFYLSEKWTTGWDFNVFSDKYFLSDYKIASDTVLSDYFSESTSTAYLTGKGDRGYMDIRGYYFEGLSPYDVQRQQPVVGPVVDYNKSFDLPTESTHGVGGQVTLDFNLTNLTRSLADYQAVGARTLDTTYGLFNVCNSYTPTVAGSRSCLLRGIAGDYTRATGQVSWQRNFTDVFGGRWQPFSFVRFSGETASLDGSGGADYFNSANQTISNTYQSNFVGGSNGVNSASVMPGIGLEYRFPLVASTSWATHVFEPIVQVVARPNETASGRTINEDAQSLVFDDTNLFEWNKFSGYDRAEGGTRLNSGAQYTVNFNSGGYANALVGQSFQLAGKNSYAIGDDANTGLDSGLQNARSYYITRFTLAPSANYTLITKANFDENSFALKRLDVGANLNFGRMSFNALYARYAAEPDIGFYVRREGVNLSSKYHFADHYYVDGSIIFDMSRYLYNAQLNTNASRFTPASYKLGFGYDDGCTAASVSYSSGYEYGNGTLTKNQTVMFQLTLRTLGSVAFNQDIQSDTTNDGIGSGGHLNSNFGTD